MKRFILSALLASTTGPLFAGPVTNSPCDPGWQPLCREGVYESDCKPLEQNCLYESSGNHMVVGSTPFGGFGALPLLGTLGSIALIDKDYGKSILAPPKAPFKPIFPPGPPFNPPGPPPWVPGPPSKPETPPNVPVPEPSSIAIFSLFALGLAHNIYKRK